MKKIWTKIRQKIRRTKLWFKKKWLRFREQGVQRVAVFERLTQRWDLWYAKMPSQILVFGGSLGLTALMLWFMFPPWMVVAVLGVLVVHELAHWEMARFLGLDARLPIFIPLFFGALGSTEVPGIDENTDPESIMAIALAGPTFGSIAALSVLFIGMVMALPAVMWTAGTLLVFQIFSITLGSDGRKYRQAQKELPPHARRRHLTLISNSERNPATAS